MGIPSRAGSREDIEAEMMRDMDRGVLRWMLGVVEVQASQVELARKRIIRTKQTRTKAKE